MGGKGEEGGKGGGIRHFTAAKNIRATLPPILGVTKERKERGEDSRLHTQDISYVALNNQTFQPRRKKKEKQKKGKKGRGMVPAGEFDPDGMY